MTENGMPDKTKRYSIIFHTMEKVSAIFPHNGKIFSTLWKQRAIFSTQWKNGSSRIRVGGFRAGGSIFRNQGGLRMGFERIRKTVM